MSRDIVLVAGGGGFIGGHLVADLERQGMRVRAVDVKPLDEWYQVSPTAENIVLDLSEIDACRRAVAGAGRVYNLAADMGGMGFIETHKALCMLSVLINTHMLMASRDEGVERFFFSSSACVYAADRQTSPDVTALAEADAYPAMPEDGYGWEKLFSERMCRHFREDFGMATRAARYHNVYGPYGTWEGGREKAPAAICRKVAEAKLTGTHAIEIWGDGEQTRSFMYVDDCVHGTQLLTGSDVVEPINIGSSELVTINQLVSIVEEIAGIEVERRDKRDAPQGVRGRNSDNTLILEQLGWEPSITLRDGMERTYRWIYDQMVATGRYAAPRATVAS
jgi:GDP-D-mannose 3', 5'-epimerase